MNQTEGLEYAARSGDDMIGFLRAAAEQTAVSVDRTRQIRDMVDEVVALQAKIRSLKWEK